MILGFHKYRQKEQKFPRGQTVEVTSNKRSLKEAECVESFDDFRSLTDVSNENVN